MQTTMLHLSRLLIVCSMLWSTVSQAEDAEDAATPEQANAQAAPASPPAGFSEAQRKHYLLANIPLGKDEGDGFWPLFRDYRRDIRSCRTSARKSLPNMQRRFAP